MKPFLPEKIYIDREVLETRIAKNVLSFFNTSYEIISDPKEIGLSTSLEQGKKELLVTKFQGKVFEHCPAGKPGMMCCNYFIFPFAQNCHMDCEYCFLQYYLNKQVMVIYANVEDMLEELKKILTLKQGFCRVGTGEYADSLALDHITGISKILVPFFAHNKKAVLELKTKTNNIANLLDMDSQGNTVVSWSMSPQEITAKYEHGTSTLSDKLKAAVKCAKANYKISFHFDPIIYYSEWERGYQELTESIYDAMGAFPIEWISLGNLRLTHDLKTMMKIRFPQSELVGEEMVRSTDGRFRYPKKLRIEMYQKIWNSILKKRESQKLYLCMENPDVWDKVQVPKTSQPKLFWGTSAPK
ncbi:MAG TPA: radical SAM protein [Bdellovibrionota bacterium]|nr:radical SAM protein [Bdellovibrionota bacterium]